MSLLQSSGSIEGLYLGFRSLRELTPGLQIPSHSRFNRSTRNLELLCLELSSNSNASGEVVRYPTHLFLLATIDSYLPRLIASTTALPISAGD